MTSVRNALADLELAVQDADLVFAEKLPEDIRWRLHVLACSINDFTFWVQEVEGGWQATEVETGVAGAVRSTPEEALAAYWNRSYA